MPLLLRCSSLQRLRQHRPGGEVLAGPARRPAAGAYTVPLLGGRPALRPAEARRHVDNEAGTAGHRGPWLAEALRAAYDEAWSGYGQAPRGASGEPTSRRLPPYFRNRLAELVAVRRQKSICAEVREVRWQVSEHVGHLRKHPEEYTAALLGFLKSCTSA